MAYRGMSERKQYLGNVGGPCWLWFLKYKLLEYVRYDRTHLTLIFRKKVRTYFS